mmetsp:Transcript_7688/g.21561  ORF Transcript_7688/g.21561 Transcript_7688/m.21561 type:complete len:106 (-) Transcript_7688:95-412(-)
MAKLVQRVAAIVPRGAPLPASWEKHTRQLSTSSRLLCVGEGHFAGMPKSLPPTKDADPAKKFVKGAVPVFALGVAGVWWVNRQPGSGPRTHNPVTIKVFGPNGPF